MLWWGRFDPAYSRNRVIRHYLLESGWHLQDFMPLISTFGALEAVFTKIEPPDAVWVPAFRQRDFRAARRFADKHNVPLVFDPLISAWDKSVLERQKFPESGWRSRRLIKWEQQMFSRAELVIADTILHASFFIERLSAPVDKTFVVPVGAEESLFVQKPVRLTSQVPEILFYGSFINLQSPQTVVEAALQVPEARWVLLGNGPLREICEEKSKGCRHIIFEDWLDYPKLADRISEAEILLGIFGSSPKAGRVIPNKVYQSLACGRTLVTRQSAAYPSMLKNNHDCGITFVPPEDPNALAAAIRELLVEPLKLVEKGEQARQSYDACFSGNHIREALSVALATLAG